ncbi:hypothetical protein [Deinococcus ruber]|uniref:TubC N-terminal docking domain-containing protein n=1 Tax=Deinococcus ruber TaxID=1848197 RepID=A0A918FCR9_9DEIO|nr:hypothetical protein [Deinococcus ruber]GGR22530.1 hypothetical protein GCM10008957_38200 [Deinococcus ruber]
MSGQAVALLSALHAAGVHVALGAAGNTLELTGKRPPAALLDEVRASKAALLEVLAPKTGDMLPWEDVPDVAPSLPAVLAPDPLPDHLARLVSAAKAGTLPGGPVKLASGIAPELGVYVLAWAECWPRDRAHVLRRLEEAHAVTVGV